MGPTPTASVSFGARRSVFPIQVTRVFRTSPIYKVSCLNARVLIAAQVRVVLWHA